MVGLTDVKALELTAGMGTCMVETTAEHPTIQSEIQLIRIRSSPTCQALVSQATPLQRVWLARLARPDLGLAT